MVKQLGSLDIHFLVKELKCLEKSRVDKVYNFGKEELYIQFFKSGEGKKVIRIIIGKALFITDSKNSDENPSHFCMMMRKHLEGKTLESIEQLEPERILKLVFRSKEETKNLYIENFAKGNVVLCDKESVIIESLIKHKFKDRTILPKQAYKHPKMQYDYFKTNKDNLIELFKNSNKDKVVVSLATELGMGGINSEEICLLSKIDKNKDPKKVDNKEIIKIQDSIKKLINKKTNNYILYKNKEAVDVVPFELEFYKDFEGKIFPCFNDALDHYFTRDIKLIAKKESKYEGQINELKRITAEQEETLQNLKNKENENRKKAEIIYNNYQIIKEIIEEINKAKEKHSWEEIKKRLKGHKVVKDVDVKEKKVVVEI